MCWVGEGTLRSAGTHAVVCTQKEGQRRELWSGKNVKGGGGASNAYLPHLQRGMHSEEKGRSSHTHLHFTNWTPRLLWQIVTVAPLPF